MDFIETIHAWWQSSADFLQTHRAWAPLIFAFLVLLIDIVRRRSVRWSDQAIRSVITNLSLKFCNGYLGHFVIFATIWAQGAYNNFGVPRLSPQIWADVPTWLLIPGVVLAMDFADYWNHRIMHTRWLWPIHSIHHSDPCVTVLTTSRVHFLEPLVMRLSYVILLGWLGLPAGVLGAAGVLLVLHNMYVHINVDWGHGPFRYIIASPRFHRWHHANTPEAYDKNLANFFPFYDVLFGTYYVPGTCHAEVGCDRAPVNNVIQMILWPATEWTRLLRSQWRSVSKKLHSTRLMTKRSPSDC